MAIKPLEQYIAKHGTEKGTAIHDRMVRREAKHAQAPYRRLTKEWCIWKYGIDEGTRRYDDHVSKSKQTVENFVARYGEEVGRQKFAETMAKKNAVQLARERYGDQYVKDWYSKAALTIKRSITPELIKQRVAKSTATKKERYGGKTRLQTFVDKYGPADGPTQYGLYLQKIFKSIGHSKQAATMFDQIISHNKWLEDHDVYYRSAEHGVEFFLSAPGCMYFYDFVVRDAKTILEFDGAKWHPTLDQVSMYGSELMEITGISYADAYARDLRKRKHAEDNGFTVFMVRSDFTQQETDRVINSFLQRTKQNVSTTSL